MKYILLALGMFLSFYQVQADFTVAEKGVAKCDIVIPENAPGVVRFAAQELSGYLNKITGATFKISHQPEMKNNIYLGAVEASDFAPDQCVIKIKSNRIDIYGKDNPAQAMPTIFHLYYDELYKGTLMGVYEFLDSVGVRWPAPGEKNEFIVKNPDLSVAESEKNITPTLADRRIGGGWNFINAYRDAKDYCKNNDEYMLWGVRIRLSSRMYAASGAHSEASLKFPQNPRIKNDVSNFQMHADGLRDERHLCWTSPAVIDEWTKIADAYFSGKSPKDIGLDLPAYLFSKWPWPFMQDDEFMIDLIDNDGANFGICECPRCKTYRQTHPGKDDSEIIWHAIVKVAEAVKAKHPGKYISTLIYPPKQQMPSGVKIPDNVKVRLCVSGAKECGTPARLELNLNQMKSWSEITGNKVGLWTYNCANFNNILPGPIETYPHFTQEFIRKIKPYSFGMFIDNGMLSHTHANFDLYIFARLSWNDRLDLEKEISDYFKMLYSPADAEVQALYRRFEDNWLKLWKLTVPNRADDKDSLGLGLWNKDGPHKKAVWSQVYDKAELETIDNMLKKAEAKAAGNTEVSARIGLLRKYLYQTMAAERRMIMEKDDMLQPFQIEVGEVHSAPYHLVSALKNSPELKAPGSFTLNIKADKLIVNATLTEPLISKSKTSIAHRNGNKNIWEDNCIELFFYAEKSKTFWQIIVNDHGKWSSQTRGRVLPKWMQMPGLEVKTVKNANSWSAEIAIPLSELKIDGGVLRFNLTRERNINGEPLELSTWSSVATSGNWHNFGYYGTIKIKKEQL